MLRSVTLSLIVVLTSLAAIAQSAWCQTTAESQLAELEAAVSEAGLRAAERYATYADDYRSLASEYPGTEVAFTAKLWLIRHAYYEQSPALKYELSGRLADEVMAEYSQSPRLTRLAELSYVFEESQRQTILNRLFHDSPHAEVRGYALLHLAESEIESRNSDTIARGRDRLRILADEYATVPWRYSVLGSIAEAHLNPHPPAALAVGAPVPEVFGTTYNGKSVSLSSYRGKVVILEFWGEW